MIPIVHVGLSPVLYHPAWANTESPAVIRVISTLGHAGAPFLTGNGPRWRLRAPPEADHRVRRARNRLDRTADLPAGRRRPTRTQPPAHGQYTLALSPADYIRRNVRVTPLPVPHQSPVGLLEWLPTVPILSSDYPHFEGNGDPMGHYDKELASVSDELRSQFLGDNLAAC